MTVAIKGISEVLKALRDVRTQMAMARRAALTKIGVIIKADAVRKAPVDTGNLRNSAYYEVENDKVRIGFSAAYAAFVHENVEEKLRGQPRTSGSKKGNYWDSGGSKFLENAVKENQDRIMQELKKGGVK